MKNLLSIIIPCFNSEKTLEETLGSIIHQDYLDWEAIIVDDGSTDNTAAIAEKWTQIDHRFKYYHKPNEGLGKARNYGIEISKGEFILPLDSDNLVISDFASLAINILTKDTEVGVVHGNAELFGEESGLWEIAKFNFEQLLVQNYIDACAIFRKSLWFEVGGYDELMPYQGNEDWELWLAFGTRGVKFHHLEKITFKYRISSNSMNRSYTTEIKKTNEDYIVKKYSSYYYHFFKLYKKQLAVVDKPRNQFSSKLIRRIKNLIN
jgi:glycosyltransferase involved in cell wall biosynthesis